jgi:MarR family transcriptional regulator, organic hydroperoxide resistance regulator
MAKQAKRSSRQGRRATAQEGRRATTQGRRTTSPRKLPARHGPFQVSWRASHAHDADAELFVVEENLHYLIAVTARLLTGAFNSRLASHGVTVGQWPVLVHLWETDGLSQRELCERIGIEEGTMTRTVDGMERAGLLRRGQIANNRRRYRIELTPRGAALKNELLPCMNQLIADATSSFSPGDSDRLRRLLRKIIEWARQSARDARVE